MTWGQAFAYCQKYGARLAEPTDPMMGRVIANLFPYDYPPHEDSPSQFVIIMVTNKNQYGKVAAKFLICRPQHM